MPETRANRFRSVFQRPVNARFTYIRAKCMYVYVPALLRNLQKKKKKKMKKGGLGFVVK